MERELTGVLWAPEGWVMQRAADVVGYGAVATPTVNLEGASWHRHHLTAAPRSKPSTEDFVVIDGEHLAVDGPYGSVSGTVTVLEASHGLSYSLASDVGAGEVNPV